MLSGEDGKTETEVKDETKEESGEKDPFNDLLGESSKKDAKADGDSEEKKEEEPIGSSLVDNEQIGKMKTERNLETAHMFHKECITHWFFKKAECPMCRKSFMEDLQTATREMKENVKSGDSSSE